MAFEQTFGNPGGNPGGIPWWEFPGDSDGKESACNVGHLSSIPGSGRSPGEENGNSLQYSCLENPMDGGGSWGATVHSVAKELDTTERLHFYFHLQFTRHCPVHCLI